MSKLCNFSLRDNDKKPYLILAKPCFFLKFFVVFSYVLIEKVKKSKNDHFKLSTRCNLLEYLGTDLKRKLKKIHQFKTNTFFTSFIV